MAGGVSTSLGTGSGGASSSLPKWMRLSIGLAALEITL
jgi:hypothetical protein